MKGPKRDAPLVLKSGKFLTSNLSTSLSLYPCILFDQHLGIKDTRKIKGWIYQASLQQEPTLKLDHKGKVEFAR